MAKVLFITTSAEKITDDWQTGVWFEELSTPYYIFEDSGVNVTIASHNGGKPPFDPTAFEPENVTDSVTRFQQDEKAMNKLNNSLKAEELDFSKYDGIFYPGGHGVIVDLPYNDIIARKVAEFFEEGKPVASVCHGPAALLNVRLGNGDSIIKDKKVTAFCNNEEEAIGVKDIVPFLIEDEFKKLGGTFEHGENFAEFAIADGNLITGQNPASSAKTAKLLLNIINQEG